MWLLSVFSIIAIAPSSDACEKFNVDNGMFVLEHMPVKIGVKGTYRCNSGFILLGNAERVCTISNEWSGQPAQCILPSGKYLRALMLAPVIFHEEASEISSHITLTSVISGLFIP